MTQTTQGLTVALVAPLTGVLVPIEQVPDPVFAEKMVGEGISIDPLTNLLVAPCDGDVALIHPSMHAITIRHDTGLEVLLHIGLDTVSMRGSGFSTKVTLGQKVKRGDPLIEFDLDLIATTAKSLLTQMVITNSDILSAFSPRTGLVTAGMDVVAEASLGEVAVAAEAAEAARPSGHVVSEAIIVPNPTGLHARPVATLVNLAKQFDSQLRLQHGDNQANLKSIISILAMGIGKGEKIMVIADGPDAHDAITTLAAAIKEGLGEEIERGADLTAEAPAPEHKKEEAPLARRTSDDPNVLVGVAASPGLGVGTVLQIRRQEIKVTEEATDKHVERRKLNAALDRAILQLKALESQLKTEADPDKAAIFVAHQELLADPDFLDLANSGIDKGKSAAYAWRGAFQNYSARLAALDNEVLAGRAVDVKDVGQRVLEELTGQKSAKPEIPKGSILIAEDLTPSDTASMDRNVVAGFATTLGGSTSHVAILARSLDIPAVAGIEAHALDIADGSRVILDGSKGTLRINVTEQEVADIQTRQVRLAERRKEELTAADEPATTTDGQHIEVVANIGGLDDALQVAGKGGDGVGLLRSEFVFLGRTTAPTEDDQAAVYIDIAKALKPGQPLVIRTLDVGGDKPLPYLPIPREENPFLGERGIRVGLDRPEVLRTQVRAILRAADAGAKLHVMFPMIATLEDFRLAKGVFDAEADKMGVSGVPLGIMVEVPSVAVMADQFAREVDFFSVGTNDLTQYTLAMDRGHPKLAPQVDGLNPAVLGLIAMAAKAAHDHGRWVGICGGIGSDPQAVPLLVGLGVDELSVSIPAIPAVKAQIRKLSLTDCQALAAEALKADTAAAVRALVPVDEI